MTKWFNEDHNGDVVDHANKLLASFRAVEAKGLLDSPHALSVDQYQKHTNRLQKLNEELIKIKDQSESAQDAINRLKDLLYATEKVKHLENISDIMRTWFDHTEDPEGEVQAQELLDSLHAPSDLYDEEHTNRLQELNQELSDIKGQSRSARETIDRLKALRDKLDQDSSQKPSPEHTQE